MSTHQRRHPSRLFTVRLWREDLGDGQVELRGEVQHVEGGETSYFRDWSALVQFLLATLHRLERDLTPADGGDTAPD
jgi:hypothetical protein